MRECELRESACERERESARASGLLCGTLRAIGTLNVQDRGQRLTLPPPSPASTAFVSGKPMAMTITEESLQ